MTFGDSITDGDGSTLDANHRWPDLLAERLQAANGAPVAVLNEGISGARVLTDRMGVNALARFDEDVLSHPRVDTVILMMGINDIGWPDSVLDTARAAPSADDIIAGYEQLIARAHDHGMRIIGATLTPFEVAFKGTPLEGYYNAEKEAKRVAVNEWIRDRRRLRRRDRLRHGRARTRQSNKHAAGLRQGRQPASERRRLQGDGGVDRPRLADREKVIGRSPALPTEARWNFWQ